MNAFYQVDLWEGLWEIVFTVLTDIRGRLKQLWVVLNCIRNLTEHEPEKEPNVAFLHGLCLQVSALTSFNGRLWPGSIIQTNPFLHKLLLVRLFYQNDRLKLKYQLFHSQGLISRVYKELQNWKILKKWTKEIFKFSSKKWRWKNWTILWKEMWEMYIINCWKTILYPMHMGNPNTNCIKILYHTCQKGHS